MLVSSQTAVKGGHGFEIAVRMDNLHGWDWGRIQNNAYRLRSMHSRSSLFSVVFMCLISLTQKFKLEKITLNTKEWSKSRFDEILELWIFSLDHFVAPAFCLIPVSCCSIFSLLPIMLDEESWKKTIDSYSSDVRLFGSYTRQNVNSAVNFVFTSKTGLSRVVLVLRYICTVAIPGQILAR